MYVLHQAGRARESTFGTMHGITAPIWRWAWLDQNLSACQPVRRTAMRSSTLKRSRVGVQKIRSVASARQPAGTEIVQ